MFGMGEGNSRKCTDFPSLCEWTETSISCGPRVGWCRSLGTGFFPGHGTILDRFWVSVVADTPAIDGAALRSYEFIEPQVEKKSFKSVRVLVRKKLEFIRICGVTTRNPLHLPHLYWISQSVRNMLWQAKKEFLGPMHCIRWYNMPGCSSQENERNRLKNNSVFDIL